MVHNTASRAKVRERRNKANALEAEAHTLESIEGFESESEARQKKAMETTEEAEKLAELARIEDVHVYEDENIVETKKGPKSYPRWRASWREGGKIRNVSLGSVKKHSREEATEKARKLKAEALGIAERPLRR